MKKSEVRRSNADWLIGGLEQEKDRQLSSPQVGKACNPSKILKKHAQRPQWTLLIVFNTQFCCSTLYNFTLSLIS